MDTDEGTEEDMYVERQINNGVCGMCYVGQYTYSGLIYSLFVLVV